MTESLGAAVQIVRDALESAERGTDQIPQEAVAVALRERGWLHDPAEVAALRAELAELRQDLRSAMVNGDYRTGQPVTLSARDAAVLWPKTVHSPS